MTPKKLTVLVDQDQIITNLHGKWLPILNEEHGYNLTVGDLWHYNIRKVAPCGEKADEVLGRPGFYRDLKPLPGAIEAIRKLHEDGHDIVIVTSPGRQFGCIPDKAAWLDQHLPFLPYRRRIFTSAKELVEGDVFIDDGPENIRAYRKNWPLTPIFTIAHPYNEEVKHLVDLRAEGWDDTYKAWVEIYAHVMTLASEHVADDEPVTKSA